VIVDWYEDSLLLAGCSRSKCALLLASDHPEKPVSQRTGRRPALLLSVERVALIVDAACSALGHFPYD
jgi:hypothetical protein